jgi:hypothetical protein
MARRGRPPTATPTALPSLNKRQPTGALVFKENICLLPPRDARQCPVACR